MGVKMHTSGMVAHAHAQSEDVALSDFCQELFSSLTRSDQRRWGEVYIRGLLSVPGRKSVRHIAEEVVGWRADQSLQQFLNQSPWDWRPVRCHLARLADSAIKPEAWVVGEAVFPKNGSRSVGVEKQYAHSVGRILNCQLGLAVLLASEDRSCPVNWRLQLPSTWDDDQTRRSGAHLPDRVRHRSHWQHLLDAIDQMAADWDLMPAPLVIEARPQNPVESLLAGLEERALSYLVRVAHTLPTGAWESMVGARSLGDLVARSPKRNGAILSWRDGKNGRLTRSQFVIAPVSHARGGSRRDDLFGPGRQVLAEWKPGRRTPKAIWITNIHSEPLSRLVELTALRTSAEENLTRLSESSGLRHFEGRSFRGWHHHVTLVSAACIYRLLQELGERSHEVALPI